jgi:hypothetical protein
VRVVGGAAVEGALAKSLGARAKPRSLPETVPLVVESSSGRGVGLGRPLCAAGRMAGGSAGGLCEGRVAMSLASTVLEPEAAGAAGCADPVAGAAGACVAAPGAAALPASSLPTSSPLAACALPAGMPWFVAAVLPALAVALDEFDCPIEPLSPGLLIRIEMTMFWAC